MSNEGVSKDENIVDEKMVDALKQELKKIDEEFEQIGLGPQLREACEFLLGYRPSGYMVEIMGNDPSWQIEDHSVGFRVSVRHEDEDESGSKSYSYKEWINQRIKSVGDLIDFYREYEKRYSEVVNKLNEVRGWKTGNEIDFKANEKAG